MRVRRASAPSGTIDPIQACALTLNPYCFALRGPLFYLLDVFAVCSSDVDEPARFVALARVAWRRALVRQCKLLLSTSSMHYGRGAVAPALLEGDSDLTLGAREVPAPSPPRAEALGARLLVIRVPPFATGTALVTALATALASALVTALGSALASPAWISVGLSVGATWHSSPLARWMASAWPMVSTADFLGGSVVWGRTHAASSVPRRAWHTAEAEALIDSRL